ncbi:MAG: integrin alpha, partial [Rhodothermales bacterium]|nr:integrin alpha [Rhodothermales bacterium]
MAALGDVDSDGAEEFVVGYGRWGGLWQGVEIWSLAGFGQVNKRGTFNNSRDYTFFGCSVAATGDLTGDGITEIAVGACEDDWKGSPIGEVPAAGSLSILDWQKNNPVFVEDLVGGPGAPDYVRAGAEFGSALVVTRSGENVAIVVGAPGNDKIFLAEVEPLELKARFHSISVPSDAAVGRLGSSLAELGDLDHNGWSELVVGAPERNSRGSVWIAFRTSATEVSMWLEISEGLGGFDGSLDDGDRFGASLATIHLNDDGVTDLLVGAPGDDDGGRARGAVWALVLNASGTVAYKRKISHTGDGV